MENSPEYQYFQLPICMLLYASTAIPAAVILFMPLEYFKDRPFFWVVVILSYLCCTAAPYLIPSDQMFCLLFAFMQDLTIASLCLRAGNVGTIWFIAILIVIYPLVHALCYSMFLQSGIEMGYFGAWTDSISNACTSEEEKKQRAAERQAQAAEPSRAWHDTNSNVSPVNPPRYSSLPRGSSSTAGVA